MFNKLQEGQEMVRIVELLLSLPGMSRLKSRCHYICQSIVPYTSPLQVTLSPTGLLEGYQSGLQNGDTESAAHNLSTRCLHLFYASRPLQALQTELETYAIILSQLNCCKMQPLSCLAAIKTLRGIKIEQSFDDIISEAEGNNDQMLRVYTIVLKLEVLVIFGRWKEALKLLIEAGDLTSTGYATRIRLLFLETLVFFRTKKKGKGMKSLKIVRLLVKRGNLNLVHILYLLEAELSALKGNKKKAEESYKAAIAAASKSGYLQDKALCHELAGTYFQNFDEYWAQHHFKCAEMSYKEWGAHAKLKS